MSRQVGRHQVLDLGHRLEQAIEEDLGEVRWVDLIVPRGGTVQSVSHIYCGLAPGTYQVGMCGSSSSFTNLER